MNSHNNTCNFELVDDAIATYCQYILFLIHPCAYDTDSGLKSGRVRELNWSAGEDPVVSKISVYA